MLHRRVALLFIPILWQHSTCADLLWLTEALTHLWLRISDIRGFEASDEHSRAMVRLSSVVVKYNEQLVQDHQQNSRKYNWRKAEKIIIKNAVKYAVETQTCIRIERSHVSEKCEVEYAFAIWGVKYPEFIPYGRVYIQENFPWTDNFSLSLSFHAQLIGSRQRKFSCPKKKFPRVNKSLCYVRTLTSSSVKTLLTWTPKTNTAVMVQTTRSLWARVI